MKCEFIPVSDPDEKGKRRYECRRKEHGCDRRANTTDPPERIHAACRGYSFRLGDKCSRLLAFAGITPERWIAIKVRLGYQAECGCATRQQWLNRVAWLNNATSPRWYAGKSTPLWRGLRSLLERWP